MQMRRWLVVGTLASAIALAGCGGSSDKAASTGSSTAPAGATPAPTAALPPGAPPPLRNLSGRVLQAGELAGYAPEGARVLGTNAASWVGGLGLSPAERASETSRLERLGFVGAVRERLGPAGGPGEAYSIVLLFRSPRAARTNLATEARALTPGSNVVATPEGIPGSRGFTITSGGITRANVLFAVGPYYYLVSSSFPTGAKNAPELFPLITAAKHLYARVHR
jgi:hypothetical protein